MNIKEFSFAAYPYMHWTCDNVLDGELSNRILIWIKDHASWTLRASSIYNFSSSVALPSNLCLRDDVLNNVYQITPFKSVSYRIFRFADNQGIGVHNDSDLDCYRLIVFLTEANSFNDGGFLILMGNTPQDIIAYKPEKNGGVMFETRPTHLHAVSNVKKSTQYLLICQFDHHQ